MRTATNTPPMKIGGITDDTLETIGKIQSEMVARGAKTNGRNSTASVNRIAAAIVNKYAAAYLADVKKGDDA